MKKCSDSNYDAYLALFQMHSAKQQETQSQNLADPLYYFTMMIIILTGQKGNKTLMKTKVLTKVLHFCLQTQCVLRKDDNP